MFVWVLFVFGGPFWRQVLDHPRPRVFKTWKMYSGYSLDECTAEYWTVDDGRRTRVPRSRTLYGKPWWLLKWNQRVLRRPAASRDPVRMCAALGSPELYARIRCSTLEGWETVVTDDQPVCAP